MTAQEPEKILYEGDVVPLCSEPLSSYFAMKGIEPDFGLSSTNHWRGYFGTWEIRNARLYLIALEGRMDLGNDQWTKDPLSVLFPNSSEGVFADWYSGVLSLPRGKELEYIHAGYESIFEEEVLITVENGIVLSTRIKNNTPSEEEIAAEETAQQKAEFDEKTRELFADYFDNGIARDETINAFAKNCHALMVEYAHWAAIAAAAGNYALTQTHFDRPIRVTSPYLSKFRAMFTPGSSITTPNYYYLTIAYSTALNQKIDEKLSLGVSLYAFHMVFLGQIVIRREEMMAMAEVAAWAALKYRQNLF